MTKETVKPVQKMAGRFKVLKTVSLPLKSLAEGDLAHVKMETAIRLGEKLKGKANEKKEPAHLANVIDLDTGEEMLMIIPAVLKSSLEDNYKDESYVGKAFQITHLGKKAKGGAADEGYNLYKILEIDPTEAETAE